MSVLDKYVEVVKENLHEVKETYSCLVTVDCVIFGYDQSSLKVLVIKCKSEPFKGQYSLLGDIVFADESLDQSAIRILKQRAGLEDIYMEEVKAFSAQDRHPLDRVITVAYYSLMKIGQHEIKDAQDRELQWIDLSEAKDMAFDHDLILKTSIERLKVRLRDRPIGFNLLPKKFTLNQLQNLYETILDMKLDKRNFRRKLNSLDLLVDLDETQEDVSHRPAKLYSFDMNTYQKRKQAGTIHFEI